MWEEQNKCGCEHDANSGLWKLQLMKAVPPKLKQVMAWIMLEMGGKTHISTGISRKLQCHFHRLLWFCIFSEGFYDFCCSKSNGFFFPFKDKTGIHREKQYSVQLVSFSCCQELSRIIKTDMDLQNVRQVCPEPLMRRKEKRKKKHRWDNSYHHLIWWWLEVAAGNTREMSIFFVYS